MKIESEKNKIEQAVQKVSRLASKHLTLPVLSCVHFEALNQKLVLRATNLDVGIEIEIKTNILKEGVVAVPATVLLNALSSIKEEKILMEVIQNNLKITSSKNSILIKSIPHEDFPIIPKLNNKNDDLGINTKSLKINIKDLINGFKSVSYSASNSNIKPELNSIFVYKNDTGLTFVATDSFRLAEKKVNTKIENDFPQTLIPCKNAFEIIKLFEDFDGEINVCFDKNQASFSVGGLYLISRLIDGSFPDYKKIIPNNFETTVTLLKNDLLNSIKASNIFSDSLNQVKFKIKIKDKIFKIESKNNDVGEYEELIKAVLVGNDLEINFNNKYITDCFQSINGESIVLEFGGIGKPLVIRGNNDKSFLYIVMPMNK